MRKSWRQQPGSSSQKGKHNLPVWTIQHCWQIKPTVIPVPSSKTANNEQAKKKQIWVCIEILWNTTMKLFFQDPIPLLKAVRPHFQTRTITFPWSQKSILILLFFFLIKAWIAHIFYPKPWLSRWAIIFISRWCHLISRYLLSINKVNSLQKLDFLV